MPFTNILAKRLGSNATFTGNVTANAFIGNGAGLTSISGGGSIVANSGIVSNATGLYANLTSNNTVGGLQLTAAGGLAVQANTGIVANSSGIFAPTGGSGTVTNVAPANGIMTSPNPLTGAGNVYVVAANGITVTSAGINVLANTGLVANSIGLFSAGMGGPTTKNSAYLFTANDVGYLFRHTDSSNYSWTIDTHANQAISAGQTIMGTSESSGILTIVAPTGGTLIRLDGTTGTGNRTVGAYSMFTLINLDGSNAWGISGTAIS